MDARLAQDADNLQRLLENTLEASQAYLQTIAQRPPAIKREALESLPLPDTGMGAESTLAAFMARHGHAIAATSGPRFWGFVTGGTTPAALMGDWLVSAFDANLSDRTGSGAGEVEDEAIQMLRELFHLPDDFHGVFVSGATMANFVALATAREWKGQQQSISVAEEGIYDQSPIPVLSAEPHSSTIKSLAMLGMGRTVRRIAPLSGNREAMDPADLRRYLEGAQGKPVIVVASAGTVNTADFDDFEAIGRLKQEYPF